MEKNIVTVQEFSDEMIRHAYKLLGDVDEPVAYACMTRMVNNANLLRKQIENKYKRETGEHLTNRRIPKDEPVNLETLRAFINMAQLLEKDMSAKLRDAKSRTDLADMGSILYDAMGLVSPLVYRINKAIELAEAIRKAL